MIRRFLVLSWVIYTVGVSSEQLANLDIFEDAGARPDADESYQTEIVQFSRQSRVLNFFPIPFEEECNSLDRRRKGICMNTYECKIREGKSHGFCALGFGVCCVFTATCNEQSINNITYFVNPDFPDLTEGMSSCNLELRKIDEDITQLRLDFVHFNLGQPNRKTGVCEEDYFQLSSGDSRTLTICGVNSGQHVYFDIETMADPITISMKLGSKTLSRLWEVRIIQVPFSQRAPAGCLQLYTGRRGVIKTMNFADNGRHLANQEYNICIEQAEDMCSIVYEPCYENAFRISPNTADVHIDSNNELGSGDDLEDESNIIQNDSGEFCNDKIVIPCNPEDLILEGDQVLSDICQTIHCGRSLCPADQDPCRIESNIIPFTIGVHFGQSLGEESPEDNLGMCVNYEQQPCNF